MSKSVVVERLGGVAVVSLNRPESLNALDSELMDALPGVLRELAIDSDVGCVVLTGTGRGFCAGGDLKARQAELDAQRDWTDAERLAQAVPYRVQALLESRVESARLLHEMPKPTIAMINGACAGAGLSLAGACDLRFAAESAVFTSAFTRAGLSGDFGGTWFWTRILGTAKARELYLIPRRLAAHEALAAGMLHKVMADDVLRASTLEVAHSLADGPRWAYAYAKANLNLALDAPLSQVLKSEAATMGLAARTTREAGFAPSAVLIKPSLKN